MTLVRALQQRFGHVHLIRGSLGVMTSMSVASLTGWLFWVIATHHWSDHSIGVATSLVAALTVIALVCGQPIATTLLARLPKSPRRRELLLAGVATACSLSVILALAAIAWLPDSLHAVRSPATALAFVASAVAMSAGLVVDAAAIATRRPVVMVARNGAFGVGKLALIAIVALGVGSANAPLAVLGTWAASAVVVAAFALWRLSRTTRSPLTTGEPSDSREPGWRELRRGYGLQIVGTLGGALPPVVLPLLVVATLGATKSGWFSITWLLGGLCFMISPAVSQALLADGSHDPDSLGDKTRVAVVVSLVLLSGPVIVYVAAGRYILELFGTQYSVHGRDLLIVLALSALPDLVTNIAVARLRVQERLAPAALINSVIALVTLAGAAVTLSAHGIMAAGWSWLVGQGAGCVVLAGVGATAVRRRGPSGTSR